MRKLIFILAVVIVMTSSYVYGGSRNKIKETGSYKSAGQPVSANLIIEPSNEVATGAYIEIEFENAVVFSSNVINGVGNSNEIGYKGKNSGYQYIGYKNYKWNGKDGFYDAMTDSPISYVPYNITRLDDYNIRVNLCNIPKEYADKSLAKFNNSKEMPYYSIPMPVYVKENGPVKIKVTGKVNDKSLSYGNYIFNESGLRYETTTVKSPDKSDKEEATEITTEEINISNKVEVSIGSRIMIVNGKKQIIDVSPYIQAKTGSTLVPLRVVSIALADGYNGKGSVNIVSWDGETKTAFINYNGKKIAFTAGSSLMNINGEEKEIGVVPEISDGRMFVPFRALGEELGAEVNWIAETKTAVFN